MPGKALAFRRMHTASHVRALTVHAHALPASSPAALRGDRAQKVAVPSADTLAGQVTVAATGEGLPGANVVLAGTEIGAATDVEGNYRIIGIPLGEYAVIARYVGFEPVGAERVWIASKHTTTLDFSLPENARIPRCPIWSEGLGIINRDPFAARVLSGDEIWRLPVGR